MLFFMTTEILLLILTKSGLDFHKTGLEVSDAVHQFLIRTDKIFEKLHFIYNNSELSFLVSMGVI